MELKNDIAKTLNIGSEWKNECSRLVACVVRQIDIQTGRFRAVTALWSALLYFIAMWNDDLVDSKGRPFGVHRVRQPKCCMYIALVTFRDLVRQNRVAVS